MFETKIPIFPIKTNKAKFTFFVGKLGFVLCALSLRGTKQSVGLMKRFLKAFAHKLTDYFVPRNDKFKIPIFPLKTNKAKFAYFISKIGFVILG